MKKRRTLIISLLLVAALCLGIGYANASGVIKINGEVKNSPHALKMVFRTQDDTSPTPIRCEIIESHITQQDGTPGTTAASSVTVVDMTDSATFNVHDLRHQGDYVKAAFIVQNTMDYSVTLEAPTWTPGASGNFYDITYEWEDTDLTLDKDEMKVIYITITMTATTGIEKSSDFVFSIPATAAN